MDPITASLFVGASFATSLLSSKNQAKIESANLKLQTEQARLQTAETAFERTKQFRQNLSTNLALSGMGFGGVSGFRGVATRETADYFADINALNVQDVFNTAASNASRAGNKARRFSRDISAFTDAVTLASQLGLFSSKSKKVK